MRKKGVGAIRRARSSRLAGGVELEKSATAGVTTACAIVASMRLARVRDRQALAERPDASALRDERGQPVRLGRRLHHHLAADREADPADPFRVDVGAAAEELDGRPDVALSLPAEDVRVAVALALASPVEEQHPVAVAGEHPCRPLRPAPARERDHGRAVLRRDVPAAELEPVARGEGHVLVRRSKLGRRDEAPGDVGQDVRERQREQHEVHDCEPADGRGGLGGRSATCDCRRPSSSARA